MPRYRRFFTALTVTLVAAACTTSEMTGAHSAPATLPAEVQIAEPGPGVLDT